LIMLTNLFATPFVLFNYAYMVALVVVHIFFALGVYHDAQQLEQKQKGSVFFVTDGIWGLATLIGGLVTVAIYWAMHYSILRPSAPPEIKP